MIIWLSTSEKQWYNCISSINLYWYEAMNIINPFEQPKYALKLKLAKF